VTVYWLDADACIQAKNKDTGAFPFGRMQKFWDFLSLQIDRGIVKCPKMVYDEVTDRGWEDELAEFFREREARGLCEYATDEVWKWVHQISNLVVQKFGDRKARDFLEGADLWVLAHAKAMGAEGVVVSHEGLREQHHKIKIPVVCAEFQIEKITIFQMLNRMNATFL